MARGIYGVCVKVSIRNKVRVPLKGIERVPDFVSFSELNDKDSEHFALLFDGTTQMDLLVRMHSECITGDVFLSERCDCGDQLRESLERISKEGGCLLYLRQEGRGIGLYAKLDAYALQETGLSTYQANTVLGFEEDERSYYCAAEMLKALGLHSIRLITNNPSKVSGLESCGIHVSERVSTGVYLKKDNKNYLISKRERGHVLMLPIVESVTEP